MWNKWNPCGISGIHVEYMESMWNIWNPCGIYGIHVEYVESMWNMWNCMESMWNMWNPCGIAWNKLWWIPPGFQRNILWNIQIPWTFHME